MRTSRHLAVAAVLGASLALAGCSSDGGDSSEPVTYDVEAVDLGEPGETAPGSTLAVGEAAWVTTSATPADSDEAVDVRLGLTVLQIDEGSTDIWADWENADEFAGFTPYLMVLQYVYPDGLPEGVEQPPAPAIFPMQEDGNGASFIEAQNWGMGQGASDECGYTLQGWDPETNTLVMCAVGLSDNLPVTGGFFNGDNWSGILQGWNETYGNAPILWQ